MVWLALVLAIVTALVTGLITRSWKRALTFGLIALVIGILAALGTIGLQWWVLSN